MSSQHIKTLTAIVKACYLRNGLPFDNDHIKSYTCGFADGISWVVRTCRAKGVEIPDGELFLTEATGLGGPSSEA